MSLREYAVIARTLAFARAVDRARLLIDAAQELAERRGLPARSVTSVSWGKDSVALADLMMRAGHSDLFHMPSSYALPGAEHVREHFVSRGAVVHETTPMPLEEVIEWLHETQLPHERTRAEQNAAVRKLKGGPNRRWADRSLFGVHAMGLRIDEGGPRAVSLRRRGAVYLLADGTVRSCPLAYWRNSTVWAYLVSRGLPWPRLYDCETHGFRREELRNTGWLSTDGAERGRLTWLRAHFPEQHRRLLDEWPHLRSLT